MKEVDWSQILTTALTNAESYFSKNELAYLALTSKIELPFRNRLAFMLHNELAAYPEIVVSREWNRVDLAILREFQPEMLLELKAMYSFDMQGKTAPIDYPRLIQSDVDKLQNISSNYPDTPPVIFTLLLATHPHSAPSASFDRVIKYASGIRSRTPADIAALDAIVRVNFSQHKVAASGCLRGGIAFGIDVSLYYWLFGPYGVQPNNSVNRTLTS